jgi:DNA-directed RNA polymerase subunit RPC12/RpoP
MDAEPRSPKDNYYRLKPRLGTPHDEICTCVQVTSIVLCHALIENPLRCLKCNREVEPERLNLSEQEIDAIANWNMAYGSVYRLWLGSREYESWAREELRAAYSSINERGLGCRKMLSARWPAYYWWFVEQGEKHVNCPKCGHKLARRHDWEVCEACGILVPSEATEQFVS